MCLSGFRISISPGDGDEMDVSLCPKTGKAIHIFGDGDEMDVSLCPKTRKATALKVPDMCILLC